MSTTLQGPDSEVTRSTRMSIAVIGPDAARRRIVTRALASSEDRTVQEFAAYPAEMSDLPRMMELNFDVVMVDLDSDENYALLIVQNIAAISKAMVMVYSTRNDPNLMTSAKRAGARDFLPIPAESVGEAKGSSQAGAEESVPDHSEHVSVEEEEDHDPSVWQVGDKPGEERAFKSGATYPKPVETQPQVRQPEVSRPNPVPRDFRQWDGGPVRPMPSTSPSTPEARPAAEVALNPLAERASGYRSILDPVFDAPARPPRNTGGIETDADVLALFRQVQTEETEKPNTNWQKKLVLISAGPVLLVIILAIVFIQRYQKISSAGKPAGDVATQSVNSDAATGGSKPAESAPKTWVPITAVPATTTGTAVKPVTGNPVVEPQEKPVESEMMDAQLAAPARISKDMKAPAPVEDAPAAIAPGAIDDGGSVPGAAFGSGSGVKVLAPPSAISAGVAEGMLIHKAEPIYPKFARDNHIGGTVVLKAKIGKNGTLQNLQFVSGPKILGVAAMDAARNWRYRPYMLNNQPVEVETSISVVFSAGKQ